MKHLYLYIIAILTLLVSCAKEKPTDQEILDSRPVRDLAVSYSVGGVEVQALNFSHFAGSKTIDVNLNDENLVWSLVSNRDWCQVITPSGKGPGQAVIKVDANDGFEPRESATLTFVAGDFSGFRVPVAQSATAFSLSQSYYIARKAGQGFTMSVTTEGETGWTITSDDFLTVEKGEVQEIGDYKTTTLYILAADNGSSSRMGKITLSSGEEYEYIYVYQFGTEYSYSEDGSILLPGTESSVAVTVPQFAVEEVIAPGKYVSYQMSEPKDGFCTLTLTMADNLSDCSEQREVAASLLLSGASASLVELPVMVQDYIPAHGLVTARGMLLFAAAVEAGESTAVWETDGVVTVKGDIDMEEAIDWPGIGSAAVPFTGRFDGGNFAIDNLKDTPNGLFNYCEGASIKNVTLGKGCSIVNKQAFGTVGCFGGIVSKAVNTEMSNCRLAGSVEFAGASDEDEPTLYVGGIVGWADAQTHITGAKVTGSVTLSSPSGAADLCCLGGIAGLAEGTLTGAELTGSVVYGGGINEVYVGGIQAILPESAQVGDNSFMGKITQKGTGTYLALGGLYGYLQSSRSFDAATDVSVSNGTINFENFAKSASTSTFVGGFAGQLVGGASLAFKGYNVLTKIAVTSSNLTGIYACMGGFLGGCDPQEKAASLSFEGLTSSGTISGKYASKETMTIRRYWLGGIAGYVNGPATFVSCTNQGAVGATDGDVCCAKSNAYGEIAGGIAGYVHGGDASFTKCTNQADIATRLYNNNGVTGVYDGMYTPPVGGGILGAFNYGTTIEPYKLTMTDCVNTKNIFGYRGYDGGIVGYCYNATISGCKNTGRLSNGANDLAAYRGGIAGAAGNATITDCQSNSDITASITGSANYGCAGGVVGLIRGDEKVAISGCSCFGTLEMADPNKTGLPLCPGGIVGRGSEETSITNCRYGGKVYGIEITENNVDNQTLVIGNGEGTISGITYWNGK